MLERPVPQMERTAALPLDDIALFVRFAEFRTLSAAARAMGTAKSTLSRRISSLERRLGVKLAHRSSTTVELTEAGSALRTSSESALRQIEDAASAVVQGASAGGGRIRLAVPNDFGVVACAPQLIPFLKAHPNISIDLDCAERATDLVREKFDLAIRVGPLPPSDLVARRIGGIAGVLVASQPYLRRRGAPSTPEQLREHSCVVFHSPPFSHRWVLTGPDGSTAAVEVEGVLRSNSLPVVRGAALAGLGIARLPEYLCARDLRSKRLTRVLPEWSAGERPVHLLYPNRSVPMHVRLLIRYLSSKHPEWIAMPQEWAK